MEKHQFNWLSEETEPPGNSQARSEEKTKAVEPTKLELVILWAKEHKGPIIFAFILMILAMSSPSESKTQNKQRPPVETVPAIVSMWPIPKGEEIKMSYFKSINIRAKSLTKTQRLKLYDASGLMDDSNKQIVAKKDILPNKPIFWSDLKIKRHSLKSTTKVPTIIYGSSKGEK